MHGGRTPAHLAAEQSKPDVLSVLAEGGADMNAKETNEGLTPLHTAIHWERVSVAKTLMELGADPMAKDAKGELAVNLAHRLYSTIVLYPGHVHAMRKVFLEFLQQKDL
jgi:ankyrin repeat protein